MIFIRPSSHDMSECFRSWRLIRDFCIRQMNKFSFFRMTGHWWPFMTSKIWPARNRQNAIQKIKSVIIAWTTYYNSSEEFELDSKRFRKSKIPRKKRKIARLNIPEIRSWKRTSPVTKLITWLDLNHSRLQLFHAMPSTKGNKNDKFTWLTRAHLR